METIDKLKVTTYKEICKQLGEQSKKSAFDRIKQLEKFFNPEGWKPNFEGKQYNYFPYFYWDKNSGRLVFYDSVCDHGVFDGEVAFYATEEIANHIGNHFSDIYQEIITK